MTADALFDIPLTPEQQHARDQLEVHRWLCQRGWTIFGDGTVQPAWVCPVCGRTQPGEYVLQINGHLNPREVVCAGDGGWLLQPWGPTGCYSRTANYVRWRGITDQTNPPAELLTAEYWDGHDLPWFATREEAEAAVS